MDLCFCSRYISARYWQRFSTCRILTQRRDYLWILNLSLSAAHEIDPGAGMRKVPSQNHADGCFVSAVPRAICYVFGLSFNQSLSKVRQFFWWLWSHIYFIITFHQYNPIINNVFFPSYSFTVISRKVCAKVKEICVTDTQFHGDNVGKRKEDSRQNLVEPI
jgi:hypothetical protein